MFCLGGGFIFLYKLMKINIHNLSGYGDSYDGIQLI